MMGSIKPVIAVFVDIGEQYFPSDFAHAPRQ
jgi:hypothetical protein